MKMNTKEFDFEKFNRLFVKNFEKNREEFRKSTEELRHVPYIRRHLPIR